MSTNERNTRRIDMYLEVTGDGRTIRCRECETDICDADEEWTGNVPTRESEISERLADFGIWVKERTEDREIRQIEYYCPECATLLRTQVTAEDEDSPVVLNPDFL